VSDDEVVVIFQSRGLCELRSKVFYQLQLNIGNALEAITLKQVFARGKA